MTGNIHSSSKEKRGKKTVIEDVEDYADEIPELDFSKAAARVSYKIDIRKANVLPL